MYFTNTSIFLQFSVWLIYWEILKELSFICFLSASKEKCKNGENEIIAKIVLYTVYDIQKKSNNQMNTYLFVSSTCFCGVNSCIASERPVPQSAWYTTTYLNTTAVVYHTTLHATLEDWSNLPRQRELPKYVSDEDTIWHSFQVIKSIV